MIGQHETILCIRVITQSLSFPLKYTHFFFKERLIWFYFMCIFSAHMSVHHVHVAPTEARRGPQIHGTGVSKQLLNHCMAPGDSARAASTCNSSALSPAPLLIFFKGHLSFKHLLGSLTQPVKYISQCLKAF